MAKLPQVTGAQTVRKLKRLGFYEDRQKGSHVVMRNSETGTMTVVPVHGGKPIRKGTLHAILSQAAVSIEQFIDA